MPVFISYSHEDRSYVDRLAGNLIANNVHVWVDRWELRVGDSILNRIQEALQESSALIVVLSKSSVASEWCKKEITAGLLRELEERRVVVLPALLEDCDIPLFLRDKLYADFRTDFDNGLRVVLESMAAVTSVTRSRIVDAEYLTDWAIDWGDEGGRFWMRLTLIGHSTKYAFSLLTEVMIFPNEAAVSRYEEFCRFGVDWFGRRVILEVVAETAKKANLKFLLDSQLAKRYEFSVKDSGSEKGYEVEVSLRWLGEDTGRDLVVDVSDQLAEVMSHLVTAGRPLTASELKALDLPRLMNSANADII